MNNKQQNYTKECDEMMGVIVSGVVSAWCLRGACVVPAWCLRGICVVSA